MSYIVGGIYKVPTLEAASKLAQHIFDTTGVIASIEIIK